MMLKISHLYMRLFISLKTFTAIMLGKGENMHKKRSSNTRQDKY